MLHSIYNGITCVHAMILGAKRAWKKYIAMTQEPGH